MESHFSKSFLTYYMCKTGIQISLLTYNSIFLFKYEPGTKASGYTFVQNSKNKGHIPTKEHMTSAAEQHGAAASRNAYAPRMLYSFAAAPAPLSGCARTTAETGQPKPIRHQRASFPFLLLPLRFFDPGNLCSVHFPH